MCKILALRPNQVALARGITPRDITAGFEVHAHVHGDRVQIEITPQLSTPESPTDPVNFRYLTTTVVANLSEWLDLGAIKVGRQSEIQRAILENAATDSVERRAFRPKTEQSP